MKTIKIISSRKIKHDFISSGEGLYQERLRSAIRLMVLEPHKDISHRGSDNEIRELESNLVLKNIRERDFFVALDERGESCSSKKFAEFIRQHHENQTTALAFGIGGPLGWSASALTRADKKISLSLLTFPHELCRLILSEQIFRAYSLILGLPYHR